MSIPRINFCFKVQNISQLKSIWTPEIKVQEIPWKVHVKQEIIDKQALVAIYLHCTKVEKSTSHVAFATFKLLSFNGKKNEFVYHIPPFIFDHLGNRNFGCSNIMKWSELFDKDEGYVKDDTMNLDITIEVADPKDPNRSVLTCEQIQSTHKHLVSRKFEVIISNIDNVMAVKTSPLISLLSLLWDFTFYKANHHGFEYFKARLYKNYVRTEDYIVFIKLVPKKDAKNPSNKCVAKCFRPMQTFNEIEIVSFADLLDLQNGFVSGNSITLNFEIILSDMVREAEYIISLLPENKPKIIQLECEICFENMETKNVSSVPCGHIFCRECIVKSLEHSNCCPLCRAPTEVRNLRQIYLPVSSVATRTQKTSSTVEIVPETNFSQESDKTKEKPNKSSAPDTSTSTRESNTFPATFAGNADLIKLCRSITTSSNASALPKLEGFKPGSLLGTDLLTVPAKSKFPPDNKSALLTPKTTFSSEPKNSAVTTTTKTTNSPAKFVFENLKINESTSATSRTSSINKNYDDNDKAKESVQKPAFSFPQFKFSSSIVLPLTNNSETTLKPVAPNASSKFPPNTKPSFQFGNMPSTSSATETTKASPTSAPASTTITSTVPRLFGASSQTLTSLFEQSSQQQSNVSLQFGSGSESTPNIFS